MNRQWLHPDAHDYQVKVTEFCLLKGDGETQLPGISVKKKGMNTYINMSMGLGKSLISLMIIKAIGKPALVIAPIRGVHSTWPDETEKWFPEFSWSILHGQDKDFEYNRNTDLSFINPEAIKWYEAKRREKPHNPKILIIDEGSLWKSHNSKRFKLMKKLRRTFDHIYILSGTPMPQSYLNLWSQYFLLDGGETLETAYTRFRSIHFNQVDNQGFMFALKPGGAEAIQDKVAPRTIRLDAIDHIKMPKIIENIIELELPPALMKKYKEFEREFVLEMEDLGIDADAFNSAALSSKLRQFVQGFIYEGEGSDRIARDIHTLKIEAVASLITEVDTPFMLAFEFKHEREMLRRAFGDIPLIAGGTKDSVSTQYFKDWNRGDINLLAVHPASVSHSINLQSGPGHNIVFMALTWSLEKYLQLIARLARQGQQSEHVIVHHVVLKNTIDAKVSRALVQRENVQRAFNDYLKGLVDYG